jgi:hypothetical protein
MKNEIYIIGLLTCLLCSTTIYSQCVTGDCKNGKGTMIYSDGSKYEGNWSNGKCNGFGIETYPNGSRYEGYFIDNNYNGSGKGFLANGDVYEGNYVDGYRSGYGTVIYKDGIKYEGNWSQSKRNGFGIQTWPNGDRYEGNWLNDKRNGKGKAFWANGDGYEGDFVEDYRTGFGKLLKKDGTIQEGKWQKNVFQGAEMASSNPQVNTQEKNCDQAKKKYLEQNPDVAKNGMDAWAHYTSYGKKEGRKWPNCSEESNSTTTNTPATDRFYNATSNNETNGTSSSIGSNTSNSNIDSPCNVKSANIDDIESCYSCRGTGQVTKQSSSVCPNCESWNSEYKSKVACHVCKDTRKNPNIKTWKETCSGCKGSGRDYEQEKRNRDFGGYDQRLVKGTYNGTYGNIEYKSISIEQRRSGGIQTEFDYSKWSTGCSCLGSEWSLPNRGELVLIMKDLQSYGVHGDGKYATNETTIQGGDKYIYLVNFGQSVLPETKKLSSDPTINDNYWHGLHCKVICIKRK